MAGKARGRRDGWTSERRDRFLEVLAYTGCVRDACRVAGKSSTSAYKLRLRAPDFAAAWEKAVEGAQDGLEASAYRRAVLGIEEPIIRGNAVVAYKRVYSDSLLALLLKRGDLRSERRAAEALAKAAAAVPDPDAPPDPEETARKVQALRDILDQVHVDDVEEELAAGMCRRCHGPIPAGWGEGDNGPWDSVERG